MMSLTTLSCFVGLGLVAACAPGSTPQRGPGAPLPTHAAPKSTTSVPQVAAPVPVGIPPMPPPAEAREVAELLRNPSPNGVRLTPPPPPRLAARSDVRSKREAGEGASEALDGI